MFGLTPYERKHNSLEKGNNFRGLRNIFDEFFSDAFAPTFFEGSYPIRADVRENEKEYVVEAEIPGVKKEDIKLDLKDDVLTIAVERSEEINEDRNNYIRRERRSGSFGRSFYVENVRNEEVSAKFNNGVLTVTLPKQEGRKENSRQIEIQ